MIEPHLLTIAPAAQSYLGVPGPVLQSALLLLALGSFAFILWKRIVPLRMGAPDPRMDRPVIRAAKLLMTGFGQSRQLRYPLAGLLHILIFFGFLILSIRSVTLIGEGISPGFSLPGLDGAAGSGYAAVKDYTALVVLLSCVVAALRRAFFSPARYHDRYAVRSHSREAYIILGLISLLMVADALFEGSGMVLAGERNTALPLASLASLLLEHSTHDALKSVHIGSFWIHNIALLLFLCYLPLSKHFHVITALPNVFLCKIIPGGRIKPPRHDEKDMDKIESLGVGDLAGFTWKHLLDFYTCTDCGRCSDRCPAYTIGTPLSPRMISIKSRDLIYECHPVLGPGIAQKDRPALVGSVIKEEELWACTTCGACEETCPVMNEYVDKIVDMRRFLVDEGRVPSSLQKPLTSLEKRGNPYGTMARKREEWLTGEDGNDCGVRLLKKGDEAEILFFTDSAAALDPRIREIARAFGRVMSTAGLDAGTMGRDEVDSGNEVRRIGEEGLFETLRMKNSEAMEARGFNRVVTTDPHAFNTLTHAYDLDRPVEHHSQLLARLVRSGDLRFRKTDDDRVHTFHDPCYLGRHNGIYDAPRAVLESIPGLRTVEMKNSHSRSFCCGGGSLYLFYEGESESRMSELRLQMAEEAGANVVVTTCPFCLINLEDAIKTSGLEGKMEVIDLVELVERNLEEPLSS